MSNNTPQKGSVRTIIFKEDNVWYGVALEFNIVVSALSDIEAMIDLHEAMKGYVESASKIGGSRYSYLNQDADKEYEKLWNILVNSENIPSPYQQVFQFGTTQI